MAVKIRLARRGKKNFPIYNLIVADSRSPRDGRLIKKLGVYNPHTKVPTVDINEELAMHYLLNGAQPTNTAKNILADKGLMYKKHLYIGVKKGSLKQEEADKKFDKWWKDKQSRQEKLATQTPKPKLSKKAQAKKNQPAAE